MSDKPYSPLGAVRRATRSMDSYTRKNTPVDRSLTLSSQTGPIPCAVLLRSLIEHGPVPDDFTALTTSAAIRAHVRPDGAAYIGAFELQGDRGSVVLVYGPPTLDVIAAEKLATMERPALVARHVAHALGPFAAHPTSSPTGVRP